MAVAQQLSPGDARRQVALVDCDVHPALGGADALDPFLAERWVAHRRRYGVRPYGKGIVPRGTPAAARADAWPPNGSPPGSDLPFLREQLLDRWNISYAILNATAVSGRIANLDFSAAYSHACNDWIVQEWLDPEPRLRASIETAFEHPEAAAAEVRLRAADTRFVQVAFFARTAEPIGRRKYWPIFDAAQECGLPIGIHPGGGSGPPLTAAGTLSYYIEDHAGTMATYQDQLASLVFEGVFARFPQLKVVLVEGGFGWVPPLLWRLDQAWERHRDEVPHVDRPPSELVREHIWLTTQPMEEPPHKSDFLDLLDELDMDERLMFATDYPHWDFDPPDMAFPVRLEPERRARIMSGNASALYGF